MPDSLMTLVFSPKDTAAVEYFTSTNEYINLDDVTRTVCERVAF